ncbi:hypothetical protein ABZ439_12660 [Streptomyces sp. NPDC005840]|uniref:hypothetical protein n=1 Tax=Streptomyces sp. NPDC005840 TaxID=3157072 RepID=UPI0033DEABB9
MIQQVSHQVTGSDPAALALALEVAHALHAPTVRRAPEVAAVTAGGTGTRRPATARARRRAARA